MSGKFNPAKSDFNKDETFANFTIDETVKVTLSEAIAKDSSDNYITVYGFVELPLVGVEKMGTPMWVYEPTLCKFRVPKKDYETEYNGKKSATKQSPGMRAAVHLITQHGFDKPFSGMFDFGMALPVADSIITGKNDKGIDLNSAELAMLGQYFARLEPLDKLDKLEGKEIKEQSGKGSYGGGSRGQKESEKLADRLAFIEAQMKPDSQLAVICKQMYDDKSTPALESHIVNLINSLFN